MVAHVIFSLVLKEPKKEGCVVREAAQRHVVPAMQQGHSPRKTRNYNARARVVLGDVGENGGAAVERG